MMHTTTTQWIWLDDSETIHLSELASASGLDESELEDLIAYGALSPQISQAPDAPNASNASNASIFSARWVTPLRKAAKLRRDYDLDTFMMVLLLDHLGQIETLEAQVATLKARAV